MKNKAKDWLVCTAIVLMGVLFLTLIFFPQLFGIPTEVGELPFHIKIEFVYE